MDFNSLYSKIKNGDFDKTLSYVYVRDAVDSDKERYLNLLDSFKETFGEGDVRLFSAPGRTEVAGNHTDHQLGKVLAASVNLDVIAAVRENESGKITIKSEGYDVITVDCNDLAINKEEYNTTISLVRGIVRKFTGLGYKVKGFDLCAVSSVLKGSGLSSSAAFEVLIARVINDLYASRELDAIELAKISQYAENEYFGKPSGLMDQMASSVGSFVTIDFYNKEDPKVRKVDFDFASSGYNLCIIDTGDNHADCTDDYGAITREMRSVSIYFGEEYLSRVSEEDFHANLSKLSMSCGDRAVLRAMHFFDDNNIVETEVSALENNDFETFKKLIIKSGRSSFTKLQNIYSNNETQGATIALALAEKYLAGKGAFRIHGGGFGGTIQCFVPVDMTEKFKENMEKVTGKCYVLSVRPVGAVEIKEEM